MLANNASYVGWWEIGARDPYKLSGFYERVFGWQFSYDNPLNLRIEASGPGGIRGGITKVRTEVSEHVRVYIEVDHMDRAISVIADLGGEILLGPRLIGVSGNSFAYFADPEGHKLGLHCKRNGPWIRNEDDSVRPVVGWEMNSNDPLKLRKFYEKAFDWELSLGQLSSVVIPAGSEFGIGGVIRKNDKGGLPIITFHIGVEDSNKYLALIEREGGKVLLPPQEHHDRFSTAMFQDPEGHSIGLYSVNPDRLYSTG